MKLYFFAVLRVFLGSVFIVYALLKFLGIQFPKMHVDADINNIDPVTLVWFFFGYSQPYMLVIATGELFAGILTAIPKTSKLGILFYFPIAANIAAVNWCFSLPIDVKILSTFLTLSSFCLLVKDLDSYKKLLH